MPIYEYQCTECGYQTEVLQKISDEPLKDCAKCGKPTMKKMVTAAAFRLKGGGWYETDFKPGDKKKNVHAADDAPKSDSKATEKPAKGAETAASGDGTGSAKKSTASKN